MKIMRSFRHDRRNEIVFGNGIDAIDPYGIFRAVMDYFDYVNAEEGNRLWLCINYQLSITTNFAQASFVPQLKCRK